MTSKSNDTVEFLRACAQIYWKLRNYSNDLKRHSNVRHVDFNQSMFGPEPNQWPGSPIGFSWDIEVTKIDAPEEETYTFDVTFESEWCISAERSRQGDHGLESVEEIMEYDSLETSECVDLLYKCVSEFLKYCDTRVGKTA